jgi:tetratricopeptide (TPR) repeat protein
MSESRADGLECLASFYEAFQKSAGAEPLRLRAVAIRAKQGSDMPLVMSREQLGSLYAHQNRFAEAESQYLQAFAVEEKLPSMTEDSNIVLVQGLGDLYRNWGKYQDAARYYTRLLQIEEKQMGSNSPRLLGRLQMLPDLMRKLDRPADAQQYDERRKNIVDEQIARGNSSPTK